MARCDEGYLCDVCGKDVETILESDLYLRYLLGEAPLETLHLTAERHIVCNPTVAQYIVAEGFPAMTCDGPFSKSNCDPEFVRDEEHRITTAWKQLQAIPTAQVGIAEYPNIKV
jgi:hypothetical protein